MADTINLTFTFRLQEDHQRCADELLKCEAKDRPFWRRTAYRTQFEFLEAWMSVNRLHLVPAMVHERLGLIAAEEKEVVERLLNKTEAKTKTPFLDTLKANVRLCLLLSGFSKAAVDQFVGRQEWDAVRLAARVRDRIAHPHTDADYEVTDTETLYLSTISAWFVEFFSLIQYGEGPGVHVADGYID